MKAELNINTDELVLRITREVVNSIKPMLSKRMTVEETIFTVETLAKYLAVSKQWVYGRVHLKEIPYIKMGKFPRFRKSEIDKWLESMKTPVIEPLSSQLKIIE